MTYKTIEILKEEIYRSSPLVNMTDNMVRVTFTCSRNEWREIKRGWESCSCSGVSWQKCDNGNECPSCGYKIKAEENNGTKND